MKILLKILSIIGVLAIVYFLGPKPQKISIDPSSQKLSAGSEAEVLVRSNEVRFNIKPDNHARIIWADSTSKIKTEYAVVYIHGFSSSQGEGDPVHKDFAKRYGCNLFLSRLEQHGLVTDEPLLNLKGDNLIKTAKEAIAIGKLIGNKVILMSTSTGGTLCLYLAQNDPDIAALILYSPNIDLFDPRSFLLTQPWGLFISRAVLQSKYFTFPGDEHIKNYWYTKYRIEGLVELKNLVQCTMVDETFKNISQPVFVGYYYKGEKMQNDIVSVPKIIEMYGKVSTPDSLKRKIQFTTVGHHAMASKYYSTDIQAVEEATFRYAEEVLKLIPQK